MGRAEESETTGQTDSLVYLIHADELRYDKEENPEAKILTGNVEFWHSGAKLYSDSAYFYEAKNSFEAFSNVRMYQGDTLSLFSDYAYYDGTIQMAMARFNVELRHRNTTLYTDSLNYDRLYDIGYFFDGGKMVDGASVLTSDWGEYDSKRHQAVFNYDVRLLNPRMELRSDTLYYDTDKSVAHTTGPSDITSGESHIYTENGYYYSDLDRTELYDGSVVDNQGKIMWGDTLYHNGDGTTEGFMNVVYNDTINKNMLKGDYCWYDDSIGYAMATIRAIAIDYSQGDSLFMHADTLKLFTFNINTDSVYRKVHAYNKVRAYRTDVQAVCDSLVYCSLDSCVTMYKDPILWNNSQQLLGEEIRMYMNDSTVEWTHVIGQALSVEQMPDTIHYNEITSKEMMAYFRDGEIYMSEAKDNVLALYYMVDEKDSSFIGLNYTETSLAKMFLANRQMQKIWTPRAEGTIYPISQIPPERRHLSNFAWFSYVRPKDKYDIFNWRGKGSGMELKVQKRRQAPLQYLPEAGGQGNAEEIISEEIIGEENIEEAETREEDIGDGNMESEPPEGEDLEESTTITSIPEEARL